MKNEWIIPRCIINVCIIVHSFLLVRSFEVISDILGEEKWNAKQGNGVLEEIFWDKISKALKDTDYHRHDVVLERAEAAISQLPDENFHVRSLLTTATERLRKAHQQLARNALEGSDLLPRGEFDVGINDISQGTNALFSLPSFNLHEKSGDVLRLKRYDSLAKILKVQDSSVLEDLRTATRLCFDAVKYDIYNKGVPKSPEHLTPLAYELVDVSSDLRKSYLGRISGIARAITEEVKESRKDAVKTAIEASIGEKNVTNPMNMILPRSHSVEL